MIFGIGTDLVEIERIGQAYRRHPERFVARLLHPNERGGLAACNDPARLLAKRWAAKEAFAKALGCGIRPPIELAGIYIHHDPLGRPLLAWDEQIADYLAARGIVHAHLSISDTQTHATAFVVLESK